jgi:hypothetical protein
MNKPHVVAQALVTLVTIPNTKAMVENAIGVRLWMRLLVRP